MTAAEVHALAADLRAIVLGPEDFLVLVPRFTASLIEVQRLQEILPEAMRGRVLVVADMDVFVGQPVPPSE